MRHAAVLSLILSACAAGQTSTRPSPLVGRAVAVRAADLGGVLHDVRDDAGKVRVVDFWATWCEPCKEQLPFLARLASEHGARGLSVYAVAFDEDREAVERFLAETPLPFTIMWDKGGGVLSEPLDVTRLPTTLVVDRRGIVREVHVGFEKRDERALETVVQKLLAE